MLDKLQGLSHLQIDLLVIGLLLQSITFVSLPEEIIFLSLGTLVGQGKIPFLEATLACQLGFLPANAFLASMGKHFGKKILTKKPFCWVITEDALKKALTSIHKHGKATIFITRFTPFIRSPVYIAVGVSHFGIRRFMKIDALASCLHVPLLLFLGTLIGKGIGSVSDVYHGIIAVVVVAFAIAITVFLIDVLRKKSALKRA